MLAEVIQVGFHGEVGVDSLLSLVSSPLGETVPIRKKKKKTHKKPTRLESR